MTSREKFENEYCLFMGITIATARDCRRESGYSDNKMEIPWRMWQASRAAIEVELPEEESIGCTTGYYAEDVIDAIEKAGLKVKK